MKFDKWMSRQPSLTEFLKKPSIWSNQKAMFFQGRKRKFTNSIGPFMDLSKLLAPGTKGLMKLSRPTTFFRMKMNLVFINSR
jgi:hypothetical protein